MPWGDPSILQEILRQSQNPALARRGLSRKFQRYATSIGLVESGGRNLRYGDADSVNFRQERAQGYADDWARTGGPYNTRAIVRRLRNEFLQQFDPGESAAQVAAQVQRPREDLRGRYAQVMPEAIRVLAQAGARGGGGGAVPGVAGAAGMPMGSEGMLGLLEALGEQKPQIATAGVAAPAFAAGPALAGRSPVSSGAAQVQRPDIGALLAAVATQGGDVAGAAGDAAAMLAQQGASGRAGGRGRTAEGLTDRVVAWAAQRGLEAGSRDRTRAQNAAAGGAPNSMHLEDVGVGRGQEAVDIPTTAAQGGWEQYRDLVRELGLKADKGGFTQGRIRVGNKMFEVQVIFGDAHDHGDHIHAGFRRVR